MLAEISFEPLQQIVAGIQDYLPQLLGGLAILIVGAIASKILGRMVRSIARKSGIEAGLEKLGAQDLLYKIGYTQGSGTLLGDCFRWTGYLITLLLASEALGLHEVSQGLNSLVGFLPSLVIAVMFVLIGFWAAGLVRTLVSRLSQSSGSDLAAPRLVSEALYYVIIAVTVALAADQLGLETAIINGIIMIVVAAFSIGGAVAIALGARDTTRNIVARSYVMKQYQRGDRVRVGERAEGIVKAHSPTSLVLRADEGDLNIPYSIVLAEVTLLDASTSDADEDADEDAEPQDGDLPVT